MPLVLTTRRLQVLHRLTRFLSQTTSPQSVNSLSPRPEYEVTCFRTSEANPALHAANHLGAYYSIPSTDANLFQHGGLPKQFTQQCSTLNETCLMIRKPALEIIDYLKSLDYSNAPMKFVLYGRPGHGKSLSLAHVLHYAYLQKFVIVHVPWVNNWLRSPRETVNSQTRPGLVDLPENAVRWLLHFKTQNQTLIKELDLRLTSEYEWSKREVSKPGEPLLDIVELGLNRSRHACEIIIAVIKEIKTMSKLEKCRTLICIDGFNAFFHPETRIKNEEKQLMAPEQISFIPAFLNATKSDWHNAAVVVTCDELAVPGHNKSYTPLYQLRIEGFHHLNPFIPILVPEMTDMELRNMLAYFKERRWLQNGQGDDELVFLSAGSPYNLMRLCNPL